MLKVSIKNSINGSVAEFFYDMSLKGRQSRQRTKFIKLLDDKMVEYKEHFAQILKEHNGLDVDGKIKTRNYNGSEIYDVDIIEDFVKDRNELDDEEIIIDGSDNQLMLNTIRDILKNYDEELSGQKALLYDVLCDKFRVDEPSEEDAEE